MVSDGTLEPTFNKETLEYEVEVDSGLESITVTGITTESTSIVEGNGTYNLENIETEIELIVTAEDGSKTTYKVKVIKDIESSSKIEKLVIKEGQLYPSFHKNTTTSDKYCIATVRIIQQAVTDSTTDISFSVFPTAADKMTVRITTAPAFQNASIKTETAS